MFQLHISRLLLLPFYLLEGKGSQARVWYKVMCQWYSYRLSRKRLDLVCFSKLQKDPFVPIHGMSYPRGDTFLTRRFSMSEKRRRCTHTD